MLFLLLGWRRSVSEFVGGSIVTVLPNPVSTWREAVWQWRPGGVLLVCCWWSVVSSWSLRGLWGGLRVVSPCSRRSVGGLRCPRSLLVIAVVLVVVLFVVIVSTLNPILEGKKDLAIKYFKTQSRISLQGL